MPGYERWNPYDDFRRVRDEVGRFLGFAPNWPMPWPQAPESWSPGAWGPSVDVHETDTEVIATVEVPGVSPDELDVTITENGFTVKGEVRRMWEQNEHGVHRMERRYGTFQRHIAFPVPVKEEEAKATCHNGVLEVRVPKAQPKRGPRKLPIEGSGPVH